MKTFINFISIGVSAVYLSFSPFIGKSQTVSLFASGVNSTTALATDASGNLYSTDRTGIITKFQPNGNRSNFVNSSTSTFTGMTVDPSGNVYVVDANSLSILKYTPSGSMSTVLKGNYAFTSLKSDPSGNIYVVNLGDNNITKITPSGSSSVFTTFNNGAPNLITCDNSGNLYISTVLASTIYKVTPNGTISMFAQATTGIGGMACDAAGNIYYTDMNNNDITQLTPTGASSSFVSGLNQPMTISSTGTSLYFYSGGSLDIFKVSIGALPLKISSFDAIKNNTTITTTWNTVTETNTDFFEIQSSEDRVHFNTIGHIAAKGTGANTYIFTEPKPTRGYNYYRLKSFDKDGTVVYSKVVSAYFGAEQYLTISPNPAKDYTILNLAEKLDNLSISVYDLNGRKAMAENLFSNKIDSYKLNTSNLSNGTYYIEVKTPNKIYNQKLLINK